MRGPSGLESYVKRYDPCPTWSCPSNSHMLAGAGCMCVRGPSRREPIRRRGRFRSRAIRKTGGMTKYNTNDHHTTNSVVSGGSTVFGTEVSIGNLHFRSEWHTHKVRAANKIHKANMQGHSQRHVSRVAEMHARMLHVRR